jgi:hypothetical protein
MKRFFSAEEIETIVTKRRQGVPWNVLAAEVDMTPAGLRHHIKSRVGTITLDDKVCPYCNQSFTPTRADCIHCEEPDCYKEHRKRNWKKYDNRLRDRAAPKAGEARVQCIGNYCGGKVFTTPLVKSHGRKLPLYRICPTCRSRNTEYCMAWGGV